MFSLNLPAFEAKIITRMEKEVFRCYPPPICCLDPGRMGAAAFLHFLMTHKGYPQALMANEVQVQLNGTKKRCDTVLYRRTLRARMIVEYKAPEVEITQKSSTRLPVTTWS